MLSNFDCMPPASREMLFDRREPQADAVRPDSSPKQRSSDVGCGFVQFCQKHIFANQAAAAASVSGRVRKASQNPGTDVPVLSQCDSFNSHFNPCYTNSSPPDDDDDDDIDLDAISLCDSFCSSRTRKACPLPAVSEMSESCFEGLQSSMHSHETDLPRRFRPLSWAGPVDDCLTGSHCSCSGPSPFSRLKSEKWSLPGAELLSSAAQMTSGDMLVQVPDETPFYWELELPSASSGSNISSQTSLPETCQKLGSPVRMGTLILDAGNVSESPAATRWLPSKPSCQNSGSTVDTAKSPKMGCLPARCLVSRDCQHVCSACGISRHRRAVSSRTAPLREVHVRRACTCVKQQRCPTPPRMLSPCVDDDDSLRVPVADI